MKYVLDSSVALKWYLAEPDSNRANQLRDEMRNGIHELLAPDFFPVEMTHAITRAERQGRITRTEGSAFIADLLAELPTLFTSVALIARAYAISSATRQGVYDCVYVALAEREGIDLIAADNKLISNLGAHFSFIRDLSSL